MANEGDSVAVGAAIATIGAADEVAAAPAKAAAAPAEAPAEASARCPGRGPARASSHRGRRFAEPAQPAAQTNGQPPAGSNGAAARAEPARAPG